MTVGPEGENTGLIQIFRENVENYDTNLDEAFIGEKHTKLWPIHPEEWHWM